MKDGLSQPLRQYETVSFAVACPVTAPNGSFTNPQQTERHPENPQLHDSLEDSLPDILRGCLQTIFDCP